MERVLITGAAGTIGRALREGLRGAYPVLRLSDIAALGAAGPGEELALADLRDLAQVEAAMAGVDAVVHLGGVRIGFVPQDNAEAFAEEIEAQMAPEDEPEVERAFHGGRFTGMGFSGDLAKID